MIFFYSKYHFQYLSFLCLIGTLSLFLNACELEKGDILNTELTTISARNVSLDSADIFSNIKIENMLILEDIGVIWSAGSIPENLLQPNILPEELIDLTPEASFITKATNASGSGNFYTNIKNLFENTTYYARAFSVGDTAVIYGNEISFKTAEIVVDADEYIYPGITIGNQVWMAKNLRTSVFSNGDPIPQVTNQAAWQELDSLGESAYTFFENQNTNIYPKGRLYNWHVVNDSRNICPEGWHMPSKEDWEILISYLNNETDSIAGGRMKTIGSQFWGNNNVGAANEPGFFAIPSGIRGEEALFEFANQAWWWSASSSGVTTATAFSVTNNSEKVFERSRSKAFGMAIRCIKD